MEIRPWLELQQLLPPLSIAEKEQLAVSLSQAIAPIPIFVLADGRIIDGHHRWALNHDLPVEVIDLPEDQAFVLGLALNLARRQMSSEQIRDLQRSIADDAEKKKKLALGLRAAGQTQAEAAAVVGVGRKTIDDWESGNNGETANASIPDQRVSVPKSERPRIMERVQAGESRRQVAADYKVTERRIGQIVAKSSAKQQGRTAETGVQVKVIHGDMALLLPALDEHFDLVLADPPYNVTKWEWDKRGDAAKFLQETRDWLIAIQGVLKPEYHLFWFCSPKFAADIEMIFRSLALPIRSRLVWHRRNMAEGSDAKYAFIDSWEMIFHAGTRPLNYPPEWDDGRFDVQTFAVPQTNYEDRKLHPTQKPEALITWLVNYGSYPGDDVLDPFAGAGTTGLACQKAQRNCTLIEKQEEYVAVIKQRLGL